eukprot:CAMPEP_0117682942 /NCGR_PEP_ID=MMETSP0804-20121206/20030_1 /TAXON_ID=1074897 /ORGANISM="Tetraselmis astigmatica, Strain CCMP880" /LENGTH=245 /DNA_ID=CAMNT_0005493291 /DNA_START=94 /DNA_END=831 /DNA_ORIENTATION=-
MNTMSRPKLRHQLPAWQGCRPFARPCCGPTSTRGFSLAMRALGPRSEARSPESPDMQILSTSDETEDRPLARSVRIPSADMASAVSSTLHSSFHIAASREEGPCANADMQAMQGLLHHRLQGLQGVRAASQGGYQKKNPVNMNRLIGSKWTAMERTFGWRHFRATQNRKEGKCSYVLLVATCDEATQFWVDVQNLKDREKFASGWLQKVELQNITAGGAECRTCSATGKVTCPLCQQSAGKVVDL